MSTHTCIAPVDWRALVDYWSGELPDGEVAPIEEQLFACAACGDALDTVIGLANGIQLWARRAGRRGSSTEALLDRLSRDQLRIRRYQVQPGGTVQCTVAPDDHVVTAEFSADLSGLDRVDVIFRAHIGGDVNETRVPDIGVAAGRKVLWVEPAEVLRALPKHRLDVALVAVEPTGDRVIAEYQLQHSPWQE